MNWNKKIACGLLVALVSAGAACGQSFEDRTVEASADVLREITAIPAKAIPASLLANAQGVAIVPGMIKGGFIVAARRGKGVIITRNREGEWAAPVFITVTGGSVGLQAGLQETDLIAVFRTRQGVDRLMRGKFTIGVDAAVAAGPVGRDASAATDAQLKAEILSYSRSRGLFAGVALDGAVMQVDHRATSAYYAPKLGLPPGAVPANAVKLVEQIAFYADPKARPIMLKETPALPPQPQADQVETVRAQLADSSLHLHKILDPQWKEYLALPAEVYADGKAPPREALASCLGRYDAVAKDARYQNLTASAEFRQTHALLQHYATALAGSQSSALKLPPPPR